MATASPFISIVIPTRDRPEFVELSLQCLASQEFTDFEVILSDNYENASCADVFSRYKNDPRFKYFTPERSLSMCDNWEFAVEQATGTYVSVISEKFLLRQDALKILFEALEQNPAELVSWWNEKLSITDFSADSFNARYVPFLKPREVSYFNPLDVLKTRFSFQHACYSRTLGPKEVLGKIYSGCFHRNLINRIRQKVGRIFPPTSPDITSMVSGLCLAESCLDIGQPLMMTCSYTPISNGIQCYADTAHVVNYLSQFDQNSRNLIDAGLPIKGKWFGLSNHMARDYLFIQSLQNSKEIASLKIDSLNLAVKAKKDLNAVKKWKDDSEREELFNAWRRYVDNHDVSDQQIIYQQLADDRPPAPSLQEIHFAGGTDIGTYQQALSALQRAEKNWIDNQVFRIKDDYLFYDDLWSAYKYFSDYYNYSMKLLYP